MTSILDYAQGNPTQPVVDNITAILQRHAQPTVTDAAQAATQNFVGQINPNALQEPGSITPQQVAQTNTNAELAPQLGMLDIMQKAATSGSQHAASVLDTFKQFAPDPGDLGKLVQAAHDDPQQITPQNAASWAASKAQELGLGALTTAGKQASIADVQAQTEQRKALAQAKLNPSIKPSTDGVTAAEDLPSMAEGGHISAPGGATVASLITPTTPASGSGANTKIITTYQGAKAPAGQMFIRQADGSVGLTPIPGSGGNKSASPKPITAAQAGQLSMVKQGQDAIPEIKRLMFNDDGKSLDRGVLAQLIAIPFTNSRPAITSPKARQLWTAIYNMTDAKLRLESGAAVPEQEVARTAQAYIGSVIDTPETALYKLKGPEKYFNDYMSLVGSTPSSIGTSQSSSTVPPGNPSVAQSYKSKYGLE